MNSTMNRVIAAGLGLVLTVEVAALLSPDRRWVLVSTGAAVAVLLFAVRWLLGRPPAAADPGSAAADRSAALQRWLDRTETLVGWSEANRSDWDRYLRPLLARQFEMATGQRKRTDPRAFQETGQMLFGTELWRWVDPDNVARTGRDQPGPGRAALHDILGRLERV